MPEKISFEATLHNQAGVGLDEKGPYVTLALEASVPPETLTKIMQKLQDGKDPILNLTVE